MRRQSLPMRLQWLALLLKFEPVRAPSPGTLTPKVKVAIEVPNFETPVPEVLDWRPPMPLHMRFFHSPCLRGRSPSLRYDLGTFLCLSLSPLSDLSPSYL
ncbi:hypothetical protein Nepgr_017320 [Nepenthes gracilis]|uniref:Secreted protein n=1 Tax=Nepenthes gracilis TaxID=150966 RepID=A0AAD3XSZ7_NEPGR|nr:hypothetical protein Nepgr_017320 [Nepenthes gracilis]